MGWVCKQRCGWTAKGNDLTKAVVHSVQTEHEVEPDTSTAVRWRDLLGEPRVRQMQTDKHKTPLPPDGGRDSPAGSPA